MSNGNGSDNLTDGIEQSALGPRQVTVDGTTTTSHSLREQIEADKYLRGLAARKKRGRTIGISRIRPGGAA